VVSWWEAVTQYIRYAVAGSSGCIIMSVNLFKMDEDMMLDRNISCSAVGSNLKAAQYTSPFESKDTFTVIEYL
jgi:hypothetical protein